MSLEPVREGSRWPLRRWIVPVLCAVVGLVGGAAIVWFGRGEKTVTTTVSQTVTVARAPARPSQARVRAVRRSVHLVILNGTDVTGLAARTAQRARGLGYRQVVVGNGPRVRGRSEIWYVSGQQRGARVAARDFSASTPRRLPSGSPVRQQAPSGGVFVLLGPPSRAG
jgi:hypothetical protein